MPRLAIDYTKAVIYKLCCKDPNVTDIYVGSTTDFAKRKYNHKTKCNNKNDKKYHLNVYQFIRGNGGWENWQMIEIEKYQATDKLDLEKRERYWIEEHHATLNSYVPTRTSKEYREDNRDRIAKQTKEYREKNKDQLAKQRKEYRQTNRDRLAKQKGEKIVCECGSLVRRGDKAKHERTNKHKQYIASL